MIMNEKIKAREVELTGLIGEDLGIMPTSEALALAKQHKVDLVCTSLMSSPPPAKLVGRGQAQQEAQQAKKKERAPKLKELRLTAHIEEHDLDTKLTQAERILKSGDAVQFNVKVSGKKEGEQAKAMLEQMLKSLKDYGTAATGIQVSGKQVAVQVNPK